MKMPTAFRRPAGGEYRGLNWTRPSCRAPSWKGYGKRPASGWASRCRAARWRLMLSTWTVWQSLSGTFPFARWNQRLTTNGRPKRAFSLAAVCWALRIAFFAVATKRDSAGFPALTDFVLPLDSLMKFSLPRSKIPPLSPREETRERTSSSRPRSGRQWHRQWVIVNWAWPLTVRRPACDETKLRARFDLRACFKIRRGPVVGQKGRMARRGRRCARPPRSNSGSIREQGEARRPFARKPSGRRVFCPWPALARSLQPAAGMRGTRRLGHSQNPSPQASC